MKLLADVNIDRRRFLVEPQDESTDHLPGLIFDYQK